MSGCLLLQRFIAFNRRMHGPQKRSKRTFEKRIRIVQRSGNFSWSLCKSLEPILNGVSTVLYVSGSFCKEFCSQPMLVQRLRRCPYVFFLFARRPLLPYAVKCFWSPDRFSQKPSLLNCSKDSCLLRLVGESRTD